MSDRLASLYFTGFQKLQIDPSYSTLLYRLRKIWLDPVRSQTALSSWYDFLYFERRPGQQRYSRHSAPWWKSGVSHKQSACQIRAISHSPRLRCAASMETLQFQDIVTVEPKGAHSATIIFLHGLGTFLAILFHFFWRCSTWLSDELLGITSSEIRYLRSTEYIIL